MLLRPHPTTARALRSSARGVSLIELLVVITIIGMFVALAGPTIVSTMQDRHAARGADEVIGLFRRARTHAASAGGAHIVRIGMSSTNLKFELREAVDPVTRAPSSNCQASIWSSGGPDNIVIDTVDFDGGTYAGKNLKVSGTPYDICFSPGGTVYVRVPGGSWSRPDGAFNLQYTIERLDSTGAPFGIKRTIRVGTGTAPHIEVT